MPKTPNILVFDSGLGGLTVLREIVKARPDAAYTYVADDAFFPYGQHNAETLVARVVPLIGELIAAHQPDIIVIACNTASTLVLSQLRAAYPQAPFVGTVPAIKPACASSKTKRVSVLGTKGTVKREYTKRLIADFAHDCEVTLVGAENLATLAEASLRGESISDDNIAREIAPCFVSGASGGDVRTDTVVLACTHYPLLLDRIARLAPWRVDWIDPAPAVARRVENLLGEHANKDISSAAKFFFTSGKTPSLALAKALRPFFGAHELDRA